VLVIAHYALLDIAGRIGLLGLGITVWYLAAGMALLWPERTAAAQAGASPELPKRAAAERPLAA
jgi:hypothetical protein